MNGHITEPTVENLPMMSTFTIEQSVDERPRGKPHLTHRRSSMNNGEFDVLATHTPAISKYRNHSLPGSPTPEFINGSEADLISQNLNASELGHFNLIPLKD
ncbi:hypothetical protein B0O99DRAFT_627110 [Bisporella sp. PMI_857]|jgi:hypothetical protein|nr:hypothetical protein B0O99DRAFT_627110 [Bisporella sp. PMI_857]